MIAVDTNILVYAHRNDMPLHTQALAAMRELAGSGEAWAIAWPCIHEFIGVVTRSKPWMRPSTLAEAQVQIDVWRDCGTLLLLSERERHLEHLMLLAQAGNITGPAIHDARIAAICLDNGVRELWSVDRDFSRFPRLRTRNPLVA